MTLHNTLAVSISLRLNGWTAMVQYHAAATVTQHDMENYVLRCLGKVIKSDQTVVGNFHLYINNLDIQVLGISYIAHLRKVNIKPHLITHHFNVKLRHSWRKYNSISTAVISLERMNGVTSCLGDLGLDAPNDSSTPDGRSKYP